MLEYLFGDMFLEGSQLTIFRIDNWDKVRYDEFDKDRVAGGFFGDFDK